MRKVRVVCKMSRDQRRRFCGPLQSPLTDSNRRPSRYHYFSRQPVATDGNGFGLFSALSRPSDLPLIATSCNHGLHKGSIPRRASAAPPHRVPWLILSVMELELFRDHVHAWLADWTCWAQRQSAAPDEASAITQALGQLI